MRFRFRESVLLVIILLIVCFSQTGCALLSLPGQIINMTGNLVGQVLNLAGKMPTPPPGIFF